MVVPFSEKIPVIHFAQLALDCYNDPGDDDLRNNFNKLWVRVDEWPRKSSFHHSYLNVGPGGTTHGTMNDNYEADPKTGFYASLYKNILNGVGVIAIRGTSSVLDDITDGEYVFDKVTDQYSEALEFVARVKRNQRFKDLKRFYVCGHSLGGIIGKMIAPRTELSTIAFNSPGVREYLIKRNLPSFLKHPFLEQKVVTYCANGDPIGNLRHDNDVGSYKFVDVLGGEKIPDDHDRLNDLTFIKDVIFDKGVHFKFLKYHGMGDMYKAIKRSQFKNDKI